MSGNVTNILRNEQYMNDATSCVFSNMLNALMRKKDHIWNVSAHTTQEKHLPMEIHRDASRRFEEVRESNFGVNSKKVIDEKKTMDVPSTVIKITGNQKTHQNMAAICSSVNCSSIKITTQKCEMSYSESDVSLNVNKQMIRSAREDKFFETKEAKEFNKKKDYQAKSISVPDVFQSAKHNLVPDVIHERKPILVPETFHKAKRITEPVQINCRVSEPKDLKGKYTLETTNKTDVFQGSKIDESKQINRPKGIFQNHEDCEMKLENKCDFQDWCLRRQMAFLSSPKKLQVNDSSNESKGIIPNLLSTSTDHKQPMKLVNQDINELVQIQSSKERKRQISSSEIPKQNKKLVDEEIIDELNQTKSLEERKRQNSAREFPFPKQKLVEQYIFELGPVRLSKEAKQQMSENYSSEQILVDQNFTNELDKIKSSKERKLGNSESNSKHSKKLADLQIINEFNQIKSSRETEQQNTGRESTGQKQKMVDQDFGKLGHINSYKEVKQQISANYSPNQKLVGRQITTDRLNLIKPSKEKRQHKTVTKCCSSKEQNYSISQISSGLEIHSNPKKNNNKASTDFAQTMLSIKIVKDDKYFEIMTEIHDLTRVKRNYPKFSEAIPGVDCEEKEFDFSADAIKAVLGFIFNSAYDFSAIRNEMLAMEILALIHAWEITKFQNIFHKYFVQNILTKSNANKIYSLASQFSLHDIKDACRDFVKDGNSIKYRRKKCSVLVTTYTEPLEFCLPLDPTKEQLSESFNRTVMNEIIFESISGFYIIKGIQIKLNVDKSDKNSYSKLEIYYSAKNITEKIEISEQKAQKHLNPIIFLYFKKNLVIRPNQKGKIEVYTDIKPCLCYTFQKDTLVKNTSNERFALTLKSNYKIVNSDLKAFFIGKLLYNIKSSAPA